MAKGFGYKYSEGKVHLTIKYGPIIYGIVVNGEWRRIIFRHTEGANEAVKSLEKDGMYEQWLGYMNRLEEVPDTYLASMYDKYLAPWIKNYIPSTEKYYDPSYVKLKTKSKLSVSNLAESAEAVNRYLDRAYVPTPWPTPADTIRYSLRDYEEQLRRYEQNTPRRSAQWLSGDWAETPVPPIPMEVGTTDYPIDRAIENMRGTEQERERALQNQRMREALDRIAGRTPIGRNRNNI